MGCPAPWAQPKTPPSSRGPSRLGLDHAALARKLKDAARVNHRARLSLQRGEVERNR